MNGNAFAGFVNNERSFKFTRIGAPFLTRGKFFRAARMHQKPQQRFLILLPLHYKKILILGISRMWMNGECGWWVF